MAKIIDSIEQARAERRAGRRQRSLELLAEAVRMEPGADLRAEAIQTIPSGEVRLVSEFPSGHNPVMSPDSRWLASADAVPGERDEEVTPLPELRLGEDAVPWDRDKEVIRVHELPSGKVVRERVGDPL